MLVRSKNKGVLDSFYSSDLHLSNAEVVGTLMPAINVFEDEDEYIIEVAVPGMSREDFSIKVDDGELTISADTAFEEDENEGGYTYREYNYQSFSRSFTLPDDAVEDGIDAIYQDGELIITIPKSVEWVSSGYDIEIR